MKLSIFFFATICLVLSKPIEEDGLVEVYSDNDGYYKYSFVSKNITIAEERTKDGSVKGTYSYLDEYGQTLSVSYTAGVGGFIAVGTTIPVDTPEVAQARNAHLAISEKVRSILPPLKEDAADEEQEIVPLSREELLQAVEKVAGVGDASEDVLKVKNDFLKLYRTALSL